MSATASRQQRRQMQRLADAIDLAVEGDRRFFTRFPDRSYRVRLISHAEKQSVEIAQGRPVLARSDQAVFVALKELADGVRLKLTVIGPRESVGEELTEAEAQSVFEGYADLHPYVREHEHQLRAAYERHRAAGDPPSTNGHGGGAA